MTLHMVAEFQYGIGFHEGTGDHDDRPEAVRSIVLNPSAPKEAFLKSYASAVTHCTAGQTEESNVKVHGDKVPGR